MCGIIWRLTIWSVFWHPFRGRIITTWLRHSSGMQATQLCTMHLISAGSLHGKEFRGHDDSVFNEKQGWIHGIALLYARTSWKFFLTLIQYMEHTVRVNQPLPGIPGWTKKRWVVRKTPRTGTCTLCMFTKSWPLGFSSRDCAGYGYSSINKKKIEVCSVVAVRLWWK